MKNFNPSGYIQAATAASVFIAWTVTSFLCHQCGKTFLQISENNFFLSDSASEAWGLAFSRFLLAFILTAVQCTTCLLLVHSETRRRTTCTTKAYALLVTSHVLATLSTNYSMTYIEAASTLDIKLMEPITMAIAHHLVYQTAIPVQTLISIPIIMCGALVFTGWNGSLVSTSAGISLAFASNIILAIRNITLKKLQTGSSSSATIVLKPHLHICLTVLCEIAFMAGLYCLEMHGVVPRNCSNLVGLTLASGIFHVAYSYISTSIVLKVMSVVSHSIANIFKRFLVVLSLSALGSRHVSATNFIGLGVAVCGLLVYTYGKTHGDVHPKGHIEDKNRGQDLRRKRFFVTAIFLAVVSVTTVTSIDRTKLLAMSKSVTNNLDYNTYWEGQGLHNLDALSTDFSHIEKAETKPKMREFLSWRLINHPEDTDIRARALTNNKDVVEEAQRVLVNILQDLLGKVKHVMLIEIATYENKGDPAITVGEVLLLRRMNVSIVYYCETFTCTKNSSMNKARDINKRYSKDELVILMQGGGNLVGYELEDTLRETFLDIFHDRRIILFSQSIWLHSQNAKSLERCSIIYSNRSNLVMLIRDRPSFAIAKANFKGVKLILAPDMAFCIGMVPRQMPPIYDIVWLKRFDLEMSNYTVPSFPANISVEVSDWLEWISNKGHTDLENAFLIAAAGFQFLQRGRIVVTDRLHGHILSILMNIPHVLIDNPPHFKLSSFHKSWTKSLGNTILVSNGSLAMDAAKELLTRYHNYLPLLSFRDVYVASEKNVPVKGLS